MKRAAAAETSLRAELNRYIHPLTGGPCGTGWEFGRDICLSEIIALAEGVEDVDHVEKIVLLAGGRAYEGDVPLGRYALPFSGEHGANLEHPILGTCTFVEELAYESSSMAGVYDGQCLLVARSLQQPE